MPPPRTPWLLTPVLTVALATLAAAPPARAQQAASPDDARIAALEEELFPNGCSNSNSG